MDLKAKIIELSNQYYQEIVEIRRHIHKNPELSEEEYKTSEYVVQKLKEFGFTDIKKMADTGVVALINTEKQNTKCIALRADMDALPIIEENNFDFKSVNSGVMHACGHDAHTAILLGTAKILFQIKDQLNGSVKLIFQPSEEKFPGGAIRMIKEGVLENPRPISVLGLHVLPDLNTGMIGMKSGMYMASTDEIYITVKGKGGHGATPDKNIDPTVIAAHILIALQQIVSRNASPNIPTVLSFGRIQANGRTNIIPDTVTMEGTLRTFNEEWRKSAHEKIIKMAKFIAQGMDADCEVRIEAGYPFLVNDDIITSDTKVFSEEIIGKENVIDLDLRMTAEDFAYFSQEIPSCFYRLGVKSPKENTIKNLHTSTFDIDENSLITGMQTMAWSTVKFLEKNKK